MKKDLIRTIIFFIILTVVASLIALKIVSIVTDYAGFDATDILNEVSSDSSILEFLKTNNVIESEDTYFNYQRENASYGKEGRKKYIYRRINDTYYYVKIELLSYRTSGNYLGYNYQPNEKFYLISIQDCEYNSAAQLATNTISETYGEIKNYIVYKENDNLKLFDKLISDK